MPQKGTAMRALRFAGAAISLMSALPSVSYGQARKPLRAHVADEGCSKGDKDHRIQGRAQVFHEACDEQTLYSFTQNGGANSKFVLSEYAVGTVEPDPQLKKYQKLNDFKDGVEIGRAKLDKDVPNLPKGDKRWHSVWLHLDDATSKWYATYDGAVGTHYNVRRYGYAGLDTKAAFPMSARWDWFETANEVEQVMGFPCARAWCLIGMSVEQAVFPKPETPDIDPMDPDKPGTNSVPRTRRVRGWFDRFVVGGKSVFLYPNPNLEEFDDTDYDEDNDPHRVVATLEMQGATAVPIELFTLAGAWKSVTKSSNPKPAKSVKRDTAPNYPYMPGAVRFGKRLFLNGSLTILNGATMKQIGDGDMWVRCASGCCNATIEQ